MSLQTTPTSVPTVLPTPTPPAAPKRRSFRFDDRWLAPILITGILVAGQLSYGITEVHNSPLLARLTGGLITSYPPTFVAILTSVLAEMALSLLVLGKWPYLPSAYISGISVGILVRSPALWPYIMCSLISITSKYAIRWRGRHLWNPSNMGISVLLFLAPAVVAPLSVQWGNDVWPLLIIWALGCITLYRLGRLHITLTYVVSFLLLAFVRSAIEGRSWLVEIDPITGPMYQLYIFFMITDPRTTPKARWAQCVVTVFIAVVEVFFRRAHNVDAPFFALFLVGPIANVIEIWWNGRKAKAAAAAAPALARS
jgi:Na+-transporting NADH:ubiquinone oxidoreductase subunit NqrB